MSYFEIKANSVASTQAAATALQIYPMPTPFKFSIESSFRQVCIFWYVESCPKEVTSPTQKGRVIG